MSNIESKDPIAEDRHPNKSSIATAPDAHGDASVAEADITALAAEARELVDEFRVGDDVRFAKGKWSKTVGEKKIEISATMPFAVDVLSYKHGWIKWINRKPILKIIGRPIDGFVSPARERLGDNDKNRWPRNPKGEATDLWQETFAIVMRDLSDERVCTWTVTSYRGSRALGALLGAYVRNYKQHPGAMPVVLLKSETKPTQSFGDIEAPTLIIVDWQRFGPDASPPGMPSLPKPPLPNVQELLPPTKAERVGEEIDDEIPF
jgi:hypothetical protein